MPGHRSAGKSAKRASEQLANGSAASDILGSNGTGKKRVSANGVYCALADRPQS